MKRPRIKLLIAPIVLAIALFTYWLVCQLKWISDRHEFLAQHCTAEISDDDAWRYNPEMEFDNLPWQLQLLGETRHWLLYVPVDYHRRALQLFPEALIQPPRNTTAQQQPAP